MMNRIQTFLLAWFLSTGVAVNAAPTDDIVYFTVNEFVVSGENPLTRAETDAILAPYLGEQAGFLGLQNAADALQQEIRARGMNFHRVVIPPQRARGSIELRVLVFQVADVIVEENEHFSADNIRAMVPSLVSGLTPDARALTRDIAQANHHPHKVLELTMRQSDTPDAIDAVIRVNDQDPHSLFLSVNNRGSADTGEERVSAGYQYSNLWGLDHVLTASYTTSPTALDDVNQYSFTYEIPLYDLATHLTLVGSYSDVDSGVIAGFFDVTGQGTVVGAIVDHQLLNRGTYTHGLQLSVFDKAFENTVDFLGVNVGTDVRSRPIALRYDGEFVLESANVGFDASVLFNLSGGSDNTQTAYTASRAGADRDWYAVRINGFADWKLGGPWLLRSSFSAQYAGEPLISGEQFGLGGAGSVRGFLPRVASADDGFSARTELWLPKPDETVQVITFLDFGQGWRHNTQAGEDDKPRIASIGAGFRWQPVEWLRATVDWARVLEGFGNVETGNHRLHFTLTTVL